MTKAKTNALDALRALIAERQQYEQWIATLEEKREGTPEHVVERVLADYQSRHQRVIGDIRGHAEELQLSISTLSSRLVEVAREEDTRREGLQEAELRAAVGEYEPEEWEQLRTEAERALEKIGADRASLDSQLAELRAIQKLSEVGSTASPESVPAASAGDTPRTPTAAAAASPAVSAAKSDIQPPPFAGHRSGTSAGPRQEPGEERGRAGAIGEQPARAVAHDVGVGEAAKTVPDRPPAKTVSAASAAMSTPPRGRASRTPPGGSPAVGARTPPDGTSARAKSDAAKVDQAKTLKCPECGTPNYATEWYCERCGGELATM